ncbi:MAG TPA: hypothetical protein VND87_05920 [Stellaceae bacterium]|nr:hypothetical protein [Stellaceae bacterium]
MRDLPGKALAQELIGASRNEARTTPMEDVIAAARQGALGPDATHLLLGRLWALERMFYYIYGGWGQGLETNDFPPSVKYLFAKQIVDESTHEMLYMDALLKRRCVPDQKSAFTDPACAFSVNSSLAYYVFSLRNLATYPHTIRIAALNLGPKILEQAWMEGLAEAAGDSGLKGAFESQAVENRSHIAMGRRIVEEFVKKPVEAELARWAVGIARRDYCRYLREVADLVLGRPPTPPPAPRVRVMD